MARRGARGYGLSRSRLQVKAWDVGTANRIVAWCEGWFAGLLLLPLPSPRMAGPIHKVETVNMTTKKTSAIPGASHVPKRLRSRRSIGMVSMKPTVPNSTVPPSPVSSAAPAVRCDP